MTSRIAVDRATYSASVVDMPLCTHKLRYRSELTHLTKLYNDLLCHHIHQYWFWQPHPVHSHRIIQDIRCNFFNMSNCWDLWSSGSVHTKTSLWISGDIDPGWILATCEDTLAMGSLLLLDGMAGYGESLIMKCYFPLNLREHRMPSFSWNNRSIHPGELLLSHHFSPSEIFLQVRLARKNGA